MSDFVSSFESSCLSKGSNELNGKCRSSPLDSLSKYMESRGDHHTWTVNPGHTLFVSKLNYNTREEHLERIFKVWGDIVHVYIAKDTKGQSRGYGFIEFASEDSVRLVLDERRPIVLHGFKLLIDRERGRTDKNWLPRRLREVARRERMLRSTRSLIDKR